MSSHAFALPVTPAAPASAETPPTGITTGAVRLLLRLESLAILTVLIVVYHRLDASWTMFAVLFLLPDLAMLPYLGSRRAGAMAYNLAHAYLVPAVLATLALVLDNPLWLHIAVIWGAHIAFDRAVGYGLKYPSSFNHTHLSVMGRA